MIQNWWIWHREWEEDEDVENMSAWEISVKSDNVVTEWRKGKRKTSIERNKKKSLLLNSLARKVKTCCHLVHWEPWSMIDVDDDVPSGSSYGSCYIQNRPDYESSMMTVRTP